MLNLALGVKQIIGHSKDFMFLPAGISQLNHDLRVADHQQHSPQLKSSRGNVWPALFQVTAVERRIHTLYIYYSLHQLFCQIVKLLKAVFFFSLSKWHVFPRSKRGSKDRGCEGL